MARTFVTIAVLCAVARATPPLPREEVLWQRNQHELEAALGQCSQQVTADGGFGAVRIVIQQHGNGVPTAALDASFGIKDKFRRCLLDALAAVKLEPNPKLPRTTLPVGLGDPSKILPEEAFEAWQRAVDRHDRSAITAMLPRYMTLTAHNCMRVTGPEVLYDAFLRWTRKRVPRSLNTLTAILEPISGDWWFDSAYGIDDGSETHEEVCLEHVATAASAVRNHIEAIDEAGFLADLKIEYTVDRDGKLVGEIGACFEMKPSDRATEADLAERRNNLETALRAVDHGKRAKLERVTLHSRPDKPLDIRVEPAAAAIVKGGSRIEQSCDPSDSMFCSRPQSEFAPVSLDRKAIERCLAAAGAKPADVDLSCDITRAGTIRNLELWPANKPRQDKPPPMPQPLGACLAGVLGKMRFTQAKGGACALSLGLDRLL